MKDRPILFSAPMVRAILDGRKTQTRRVVKDCKDLSFGCRLRPHEIAGEINAGNYENSKLGQPGDRLWVRETWAQPTTLDPGPTFYRADYPACVPSHFRNVPPVDQVRWRPSIHMPRTASRIDLEVTGIRVEKLQDISDRGPANDCTAEGVFHCGMECPTYEQWHGAGFRSAEKFMYRALWESINGAGSWTANPWVWVVEFKRIGQ